MRTSERTSNLFSLDMTSLQISWLHVLLRFLSTDSTWMRDLTVCRNKLLFFSFFSEVSITVMMENILEFNCKRCMKNNLFSYPHATWIILFGKEIAVFSEIFPFFPPHLYFLINWQNLVKMLRINACELLYFDFFFDSGNDD